MSDSLMIGWTTVSLRGQADELARGLVGTGLAVCVQIETGITSHYRWQGQLEETAEVRLTIKLLKSRLPRLESYLNSHHPYAVPEWIAVDADHVGEKYLSWAHATPSNPPL